jgi:hypothetical protein
MIVIVESFRGAAVVGGEPIPASSVAALLEELVAMGVPGPVRLLARHSDGYMQYPRF